MYKGFIFNDKKIDIPKEYIKKASVVGSSLVLEDSGGTKTTFKAPSIVVDTELSGTSKNPIANSVITNFVSPMNERIYRNESAITNIPEQTEAKISEKLNEYTEQEQNFEAQKNFRTVGILGREVVRTEDITYPLVSYSVENISDYGFELNDAGYYESTNKGIDASFAMCKVTFVMGFQGDLEFELINFAESAFDYGVFSNIGQVLDFDNQQGYEFYQSYNNIQSPDPTTLVYHDVPAGENFITIKFVKDGSAGVGNDSLQFKVATKIGTVTETWTETKINTLVANEKDELVYNGQVVQTGAGSSGGISQETDPTVPAWAKEPEKPTYKYSEILEKPTDLATETFVKNEIANAQLGGSGGSIDLSGYATKDELKLKADKTELEGYVTDEELNNKGYLTSVPEEYKTKAQNDALYQEKGSYLTAEDDPTVPSFVKSITQEDITGWNNKATTSYVDTKVSNLINSAPETLDTLGELAVAIKDNESVIGTLNSAIGTKANKTDLNATNSNVSGLTTRVGNLENNKADKTEVPAKVSDLTNDAGYISGYTETDPTVPSFVKNITQGDISNWNNKVDSSALSGYVNKTNDLYVSSLNAISSSNEYGLMFNTNKNYDGNHSQLQLLFNSGDFENSTLSGGGAKKIILSLKDVVKTNNIIDLVYPIGSIYLTVSNETLASSPASWLGGNWELLPEGKALWTATSGAGTTIDAGLPNLTGSIDLQNHNGNNATTTTGTALSLEKGETRPTALGQTSNNKASTVINLDASTQSAVYGKSDTVQPPAYKVYAWRRIP